MRVFYAFAAVAGVVGFMVMIAFLPRRCCGRTFPDSFSYAKHRHTAHQDMP